MSGTRSEQCWAAQRHLPDVCPMRRTCEAVGLERDALRVEVAGLHCEVAGLRAEVERLHAMNLALSERCTGQAEILSQRAEGNRYTLPEMPVMKYTAIGRTTADDLRDGEGEG